MGSKKINTKRKNAIKKKRYYIWIIVIISAAVLLHMTMIGCNGGVDTVIEEDGPPFLVEVTNQTLDDLTTLVTMEKVRSDGPGWIIIHEDSGGSAGPIIGKLSISDGTS